MQYINKDKIQRIEVRPKKETSIIFREPRKFFSIKTQKGGYYNKDGFFVCKELGESMVENNGVIYEKAKLVIVFGMFSGVARYFETDEEAIEKRDWIKQQNGFFEI